MQSKKKTKINIESNKINKNIFSAGSNKEGLKKWTKQQSAKNHLFSIFKERFFSILTI